MKRLLAILVLLAAPLHAWTPGSDQRIAKKSAELAPRDLRVLIEIYQREYALGLERAQAEEHTDAHQYIVLSRSGKLRERIERETQGIVTMIRKGAPMQSVVERLGGLVHLVADANNPFHISDDERLSLVHDDFERYFERRLAKFPTVFYGLDREFRLQHFLDRTFSRTSKFPALMSEEYFRTGEQRNSADFDDRSTAFGVASVCYSHAVTDMVNLYYYIWGQAGGDVRSASLMRSGNLVLNR